MWYKDKHAKEIDNSPKVLKILHKFTEGTDISNSDQEMKDRAGYEAINNNEDNYDE